MTSEAVLVHRIEDILVAWLLARPLRRRADRTINRCHVSVISRVNFHPFVGCQRLIVLRLGPRYLIVRLGVEFANDIECGLKSRGIAVIGLRIEHER